MTRLLRSVVLALVSVMLLSPVGSANAQPPLGGDLMGGMTAVMDAFFWGRLLQSEKVRKELKLDETQITKLGELEEKNQAKVREFIAGRDIMKEFREFGELSAEQKEAKLAEVRKVFEKLADEQQDAIEKLLKKPQIDRLEEIGLQVRGVQALQDKTLQDAIGLSAEQRDQLKKTRDEFAKKIQELFSNRGGGFEGMRENFEKARALRKEGEEKALAVLTAKQRDEFEKLKGVKVEGDPAELLGRGFGRMFGGGPPR